MKAAGGSEQQAGTRRNATRYEVIRGYEDADGIEVTQYRGLSSSLSGIQYMVLLCYSSFVENIDPSPFYFGIFVSFQLWWQVVCVMVA